MSNNLKKGIIAIFGANVINLIFNLLTNFLLPKYLSVSSYAAIKTFQLYTTYTGVFALGYSDGMYLRYGGKTSENIDHHELKTGLYSFRIMMIIESVLLVPIALLYGDKVIIGFTLTIFTVNMANYFKNLYQAIGEFKKYGQILNWTTIATFAINMILLFAVRTDDYFTYLLGYGAIDFIIWIMLEINISGKLAAEKDIRFNAKLLWEDIRSGFLLMIGNFSNILLSSMDRWFVKIMMDTTQFAYYSFAVSLEGFLNVAITPITTTLYNYFCNHSEKDDVIEKRKYVMIFGAVIAAAAFPARFLIEIFLKKYSGSIQVVFILFASEMIYIIIKGIYVNLYKAKKQQVKYFERLVTILIIGAILNYSFVKIYPYKEAFSYGTLVSALIWLIFCIKDFKQYEFHINEWLFLIIEISAFISLGVCTEALVGLALYIIISIISIRLLMRAEFVSLINQFRTILKKYKNGRKG